MGKIIDKETREAEFKKAHNLYYSTKNPKYLWEMYPYVRQSVAAHIAKKAKGKILDLGTLSDEAALYFLKRCTKNGPINCRLTTYAGYLALYVMNLHKSISTYNFSDIDETEINNAINKEDSPEFLIENSRTSNQFNNNIDYTKLLGGK